MAQAEVTRETLEKTRKFELGNVKNSLSDPYSQNPEDPVILGNPVGSGSGLLLTTDPIRIRIQTKIYDDQI
jgi:hypothetical protein